MPIVTRIIEVNLSDVEPVGSNNPLEIDYQAAFGAVPEDVLHLSTTKVSSTKMAVTITASLPDTTPTP